MPQQQTEKKPLKLKWLIPLMLLITVAAVAITVSILLKPPTVQAPDFAPQSVDDNAHKMEDENTDKLETQEGGGAISLTYSTQVEVDLEDGQAHILFQNPTRSTQDVVLQLVVGEDDQETLVAQSQLIPAGYALDSLELEEPVLLTQGGYEGEFRVLSYDPESGEKAVVNTVIPVDITVQT